MWAKYEKIQKFMTVNQVKKNKTLALNDGYGLFCNQTLNIGELLRTLLRCVPRRGLLNKSYNSLNQVVFYALS